MSNESQEFMGRNPNNLAETLGSKKNTDKAKKKRKKEKKEKKRQEKRFRKLEKKIIKKDIRIKSLGQELKHKDDLSGLQQELYRANAKAETYEAVLDKLLSRMQQQSSLPEHTIEGRFEELDD